MPWNGGPKCLSTGLSTDLFAFPLPSSPLDQRPVHRLLSKKIEDQRVSVRRVLQGRVGKIINKKFRSLRPSLTMYYDMIPFSLFCLFFLCLGQLSNQSDWKQVLLCSHTGEKRCLHTLSNASTCLCLSFWYDWSLSYSFLSSSDISSCADSKSSTRWTKSKCSALRPW